MYSWEQCKLGSIGSTYTGLSGKTKEDFGHGEAQYITYLNVFQNTVSDITMTDKVEIDTTQNEVKYGDVLFTTSSETPEEEIRLKFLLKVYHGIIFQKIKLWNLR